MTEEELQELSLDERISLWNDYLYEINDVDSIIYNNTYEELNEFFRASPPGEIIRMVYYGSYRFYDDYFSLNGYGNLISFNVPDIDEKALLKYLNENE